MSKDTLIAIGGGCVSALASLAFLTRSPAGLMFVYLAPLPLLLVGLGLGSRLAVFSAVAGLVLSGLIGGGMAAMVFGMVNGLPALLVIRQMLLSSTAADGQTLWYPPGGALSMVTVAGGGMLAMAFLYLSGGGGMQAAVAEHLNEAFLTMWPNLPGEDRVSIVAVLTPFFPGAVTAVWVGLVCLNSVVAQGLLARLGHNLRPTPVYADLELPDWISWFLVGAAALALVGTGQVEYLGRNLALIFALPFFLLGLAVIHTVARRMPAPRVLLSGFYLVMMLFGSALIAVAGIGLIEQWIGLRRRIANANDDQEDR